MRLIKWSYVCICQELDHTVSNILSKTADTNHFIRDDAMKTLEAMVENVPPQKALAVLITHGTGYDHDFFLLVPVSF